MTFRDGLLKARGQSVIDNRLYLILFDAARSHYYQNALPDFEAMVTTARLRGQRRG